MEDSSSVVDKSTLTTPSDVSAVPISLEDNTLADNPTVSTPAPQQKLKFSNLPRKIAYFILGSIFIFMGLSMLSQSLIGGSLVCISIAIIIFKFEVSTLIAPDKPKFSHVVLYITYFIVASISLIFGLLITVSLPVAGIFFLLMTIIFLNFAFLWNPEEQIIRSKVAWKNLLKTSEKRSEQKRPERNRLTDINVAKIDGRQGYELEGFLKTILKSLGYLWKNLLKALEKRAEQKRLKRNRLTDINVILAQIDGMGGYEFEVFMEHVCEQLGYSVYRTKSSGDQGADLILTSKNRTKTAVQIKRYSGKVSNGAVQEVVASKGFYKCTEGMVVTNSYFTNSAKQLAEANDIDLIDRDGLIKMIKKVYN
ncbi:restriction endonuclease [Methanosarcina sp. 1.H.A.2.2]|uniref:restriction endonuclease n=1 Tax=Methanosarcina sp. 1.H.A.2.2 TaxID=1483601 RepID=UPI000A50DF71|nr:restriction endonuclease [Methanosarcina sp. 1.H.A.2.2]